MDFNSLSLDELKRIRKDVEKAIQTFEERARKKALSEAEAVLRQHGFTVEQILGKPAKATRAQVLPKYANPADPSETWSGRGRKPRWVVAALDAGKTMDDLTI